MDEWTVDRRAVTICVSIVHNLTQARHRHDNIRQLIYEGSGVRKKRPIIGVACASQATDKITERNIDKYE